MESLGKAIYAALSANSAVTAITTAIAPGYTPQRVVFPNIEYDIPQSERDRAYDGATGVVNSKVTIRCIAQDYLTADSLANAVIAAIDDESGDYEVGSGAIITVQGFFLEDDTDEQFTNASDESMTLFARVLTFDVWFNLD